jgi:hypothetical protein
MTSIGHCEGCSCPTDRRILDSLRHNGPMNLVQLVTRVAISPRLVSAALDQMWADGKVARGYLAGESDRLVYSAAP